jgi:hypothetical protein
MRARALIATLALLVLAGCGSNSQQGSPDGGPDERSERLVDYALQPPWVTALDLDPATGDLLLGTNKGFWRIKPDDGSITRIQGTIAYRGKSDTVGTFIEVEPLDENRWVGSGHPDNQNTLPQYLGFIESTDQGKTWEPVSRMGDADLHKIVQAHGKLYAFDAVLSAMLITEDGGKTFEERFTPRGLIADFVVDPEDPDYLLAATEDQLYRSEDGGDTWRGVVSGTGIRLEWPEPGRLIRADQDGTVYESTDRGATFSPIGKIEGEAYKFETTDDPNHLYMATSEGAILETLDGGRSWKEIFTP